MSNSTNGGGEHQTLLSDTNNNSPYHDVGENFLNEDANNGTTTTNSDDCKHCACFEYDGVLEARGIGYLSCARGAIVMANLILTVTLIYLADEAAGCEDLTTNCTNKIYGFEPASLISNAVVLSGILAAIFMPVVGAILDCTPHRRTTGLIVSITLTVTQAIQICVGSRTWVFVLILQGIAGFLYIVTLLPTFAYMPELARKSGQEKTTQYVSKFYRHLYASEIGFGFLVIGVTVIFQLDTVAMGQLCQLLISVYITIFFVLGWRLLPDSPPVREVPPGTNLFWNGFSQVWTTMKAINKTYKNSLRWFLCAVLFGEAAANAFASLAVVYCDEALGMTSSSTASVVIVTLIASMPGTALGAFVTSRTNPSVSLRLSLLAFATCTIIAGLVLKGPEDANYAYIFGILWGAILGWYISTENLFFAMCLPKGQEAEITGFYVYCCEVLLWLPPLVFTIMNELQINLSWCLMMFAVYLIIAMFFLSLVAPWEQALEETNPSVLCRV